MSADSVSPHLSFLVGLSWGGVEFVLLLLLLLLDLPGQVGMTEGLVEVLAEALEALSGFDS